MKNYKKIKEDEKNSIRITVRLNHKEWKRLQRAKLILDVKEDSTALKSMFRVGLNVIRNTFGDNVIIKITTKKQKFE